MISNSADSAQKLKQFFNNELIELDVADLIRINTLTTNSAYFNSLYIKNSNLQTINFENLEQSPFILSSENLREIKLDKLKRIEPKDIRTESYQYSNIFNILQYNFLCNSKITNLSLPNFEGVTNNSSYLDYGSSNSIVQASFSNNYWLKTVSLGNKNMSNINDTHLNGYWFSNCYFLKYLILNYPFFIPLSSNQGLSTTPIANTGRIYVPSELLAAYTTGNDRGMWADFSSRFFPLEQYEIDKTLDSDIPDSWSTILERCNNKTAANYYNIGQTKTVVIDGKPTRMMIVNKATSENETAKDKCTGVGTSFYTEGENAQLTWIEATLSRFDQYRITSTEKTYESATSFQSIMDDIFNSIEEPVLKTSNGIKEVSKYAYGLTSTDDTPRMMHSGNYKIWPPSASEIGFYDIRYTYDQFGGDSIRRPNYRLGETNLYTVNRNSPNINIALRDFRNKTNNRPIAIVSGQDNSTIEENPNVDPYIIFGFCT